MKVAIACTGIDQVQRGFERMFREVFQRLRGDLDATLFKGGGRSGDGERRIYCLQRTGLSSLLLPLHLLAGRQRYHSECLTFGLGLHRRLVREGFELVYCIDSPLAKVLMRLRDRSNAAYKVLYVEGASLPFDFQPRADFVHHVAEPAYEDALAAGFPSGAMEYVPVGVPLDLSASPAPRRDLRAKYGVAPETFVILDVSALNRPFKRIDHLIDEAARIEGDLLLWLDGTVEEPDLVDLARERLRERVRITHVPTSDVRELYALADVMPHPALVESFGLALVEAMSTGLPVVTHDSRHFRWLTGRAAGAPGLVDMARPGALAQALAGWMLDRERLAALSDPQAAWSRFDWSVVRPQMLAMFERACRAPRGGYVRAARA